MRCFAAIALLLLAVLLLAGCLYVPGGPGVRGGLDYVITPAGTFIFPDIEVEHRGRIVVPPPGGYRRY